MTKRFSFLEGNITPTFFVHSIPVMLSMLFASSAAIIDGWFVGKYIGEIGLATVNIVGPILNIMWGMNIMLIVGSTVSMGKQLGAQKYEMSNYIFSKTLIGLCVANIVFSIVAVCFQDSILKFVGATPEVLEAAKDYYFYIIVFTILYGINLALSYFIRLEGRTTFVAFALVIFVIFNIILDYIFIAYMGLGMKGAAWGTSFAELASTIFLLTHYLNKKSVVKFSFKLKRWRRLLRSCYSGFSELVTESSIGLLAMLFNIALIKYTSINGVVAFTIVNYLLLVQYTMVTAIGDTLQPILSINFGRQRWDRVMGFILRAFGFSFAIGIVFALILFFGAEYVADYFLKENSPETLSILRKFANVFWIAFLFNGITMNIATFFVATGRSKYAVTVSSLAGIVCPLLAIKLLPLIFGENGIYWALPISQATSFIIATSFFYFYRQKDVEFLMDKSKRKILESFIKGNMLAEK
ncbi:MAG: MATE family efflux transporter [Alphaproteobacteria bacterium]